MGCFHREVVGQLFGKVILNISWHVNVILVYVKVMKNARVTCCQMRSLVKNMNKEKLFVRHCLHVLLISLICVSGEETTVQSYNHCQLVETPSVPMFSLHPPLIKCRFQPNGSRQALTTLCKFE